MVYPGFYLLPSYLRHTQPNAATTMAEQLNTENIIPQAGKSSLEPIYVASSPQSVWSFTQGLICGQLSVIAVLIVFIKFFVFADSPPSSLRAGGKTAKKDGLGVIVKRKQTSETEKDAAESENPQLASILEKTYYDVTNHKPETLDWFNVLVAQTILQFRGEALVADNIYHSLNEYLEKLSLPDYLGEIRLTEIDVGDDFPIFSNCRIMHNADLGRLEAKIDVDLSDTLTLGIETKLVLNHPRPASAVLPVLLTVSMVRFLSCLTLSLVNTNDEIFGAAKDEPGAARGTALMFLFSPDFRLEFSIKSLIGSRAKLQDVPKLSDLIENKLRSWFTDRCIEPRFQIVKLPSIWPKKENTREPGNAPAE